ncbi:MAG: diaminopimelate decarboxylase [Candidatus Bathyarchaeia archaeon]
MIKSPLENVGGELYIDGVSTLKLADEFDTPLYVMSETKIRENYRRLKSALLCNYDKIRILYSAKANTSLSILRILEKEGAGLDAVSPGEVFLAFKAGFPSIRILYTGTSVRDDELKYLIKEGVTINVDSTSQLKRLLRLTTPDILSVRINPELGAGHHEHVITAGKMSKFGIWEDDAVKAYEIAKIAGVSRFGIQMHIGSGIMSIELFIPAAEKFLEIAKNIHERIGVDFDFIDFGGGIGVSYRPGEKEIDLNIFSDKLVGLFKRKVEEYSLDAPELWLEPGRYLVAEAGVLLTRVNTVKSTPFRRFIGVDAGFNTLIRPAMYGSYHHILVANKLDNPTTEEYDVVGPLCESGDVFARGRLLPKLAEGDLLAILNAGAYGFSMSSQYNSRLRASELLVKEGHYEIIRERETFEDLLKGQRIAGWLEE